MTAGYIHYIDPGHSWLRVPVEDLQALSIEHQISEYSPEQGGFRYLEEDCDLTLFIDAMAARDQAVEASQRVHVDDFWQDVLQRQR